eukprot:13942714-Alexandrium_andersonii.AAC.1
MAAAAGGAAAASSSSAACPGHGTAKAHLALGGAFSNRIRTACLSCGSEVRYGDACRGTVPCGSC